jgi:hypothetical protein
MRNHFGKRTEMRRSFRCPACGQKVAHLGETALGRPDEFAPEPGQLSQCEHCHSFLEYALDASNAVVLIRAPFHRIRAFKQLAVSAMEPRLPALLEYVMTYRRMPESNQFQASFRPLRRNRIYDRSDSF